MTATASSYPKEVYSSTEEHEERPLVPVSEDGEDEEKLETRAGKRVRKEEVWRDVLSTSTGRDKALVCYFPLAVIKNMDLTHYTKKLIQYSMRVYLFFHAGLRNSRMGTKGARSPWEIELFQKLDSTMSGLSLTRSVVPL